MLLKSTPKASVQSATFARQTTRSRLQAQSSISNGTARNATVLTCIGVPRVFAASITTTSVSFAKGKAPPPPPPKPAAPEKKKQIRYKKTKARPSTQRHIKEGLVDPAARVFVHGIPPVWDWYHLKTAFAIDNEIGLPVNATVFRRAENNKSKCCGIVQYADFKTAVRALLKYDGMRISGKRLRVLPDRNTWPADAVSQVKDLQSLLRTPEVAQEAEDAALAQEREQWQKGTANISISAANLERAVAAFNLNDLEVEETQNPDAAAAVAADVASATSATTQATATQQ